MEDVLIWMDAEGGMGGGSGYQETYFAAAAVARAEDLLRESIQCQRPEEESQGRRMQRLMTDRDGKAFTIAMTDQVLRPPSARRAASQLRYLLRRHGIPDYPPMHERAALWLAAAGSAVMPGFVMKRVAGQLRRATRKVILPGEPGAIRKHLLQRREEGMRLNINLLGEAVLGEAEARKRLQRTIEQLRQPECDYVSVKLSAIFSQINVLAYRDTLEEVKNRLRVIYEAAMEGGKPYKFVNLDMEEYRDVHLTLDAFREVLSEDEFRDLPAGIVLQAYLPDSHPLQRELTEWAREHVARGRAPIKIRIVKGANLAMEQVEASLHGWEQAPYTTKAEVDANFKRMLRYGCLGENARAARLGVASHNLFDVAYAMVLRERQGVEEFVRFEMLEGMADHQARAVRGRAGDLLMYSPVVRKEDFHSAVAYLVRRLDENTGPENFLAALFGMQPGDPAWERERARFLDACTLQGVPEGPRRRQDRRRAIPGPQAAGHFTNVPDTDWTLPANRAWVTDAVDALHEARPVEIPFEQDGGGDVQAGRDPSRPGEDACLYEQADEKAVERALEAAAHAAPAWREMPVEDRAVIIRRCAVEIAKRRGDLIATMVMDAGKAVSEADPEVSEAIDFANYYANAFDDEGWMDGLEFEPLGVVVVTPPWNFPFAIPCGGVLAALMAGNAVILKPASETVLTAWRLCECLWDSGIPDDVLQFVPAPGGGAGSKLISDGRVGGVILTGAHETARRFLELNPKMRLFAETSGKNAMVITAAADLDQAVKDLVQSAFGHAGQKCSAASLALVEGSVYDSEVFRRQLADAARSWKVGSSWDFSSRVTPIIREAGEDLERGLTRLDDGEEWLLEPRQDPENPRLWSPGIRLGVKPGSWYHRTECFGPVLGLIRCGSLGEAIAIQNSSSYGLTGGIQSLDERETARWMDEVEVGNAYVNRGTTGAIVRRQPFGGWKQSAVGPGAKAGGPNYVQQFGRWRSVAEPRLRGVVSGAAAEVLPGLLERFPDDAGWLEAAAENDAAWWKREFGCEHDPSQLHGERNIFRYRPVERVVVRFGAAAARDAARLLLAGRCCGVEVELSCPDECEALADRGVRVETAADLAERIAADAGKAVRLRHLLDEPEVLPACHAANVPVLDGPVTPHGRVELLAFLREQSVSITTHRYGNVMR